MENPKEQDTTQNVIWRKEKAIERLGGEEMLLRKLAKLFLRDTPSLLENTRLGLIAEDYQAAFIPLHSIKGTSSSFCADDLEDICGQTLKALSKKDWEQAASLCSELTEQYKKLKPELEQFFNLTP